MFNNENDNGLLRKFHNKRRTNMFKKDKVKVVLRKFGFQLGIPILVGAMSITLISCSNMASLGGPNSGSANPSQMADIYGILAKPDNADVYYVKAPAPPEPGENPAQGQGTLKKPFRTLARVETVSGPGDIIYILPSPFTLDGGITLQDGQSLLGLGVNPVEVDEADTNVRITNTDPSKNVGTAIRLANDNTVAGIHIVKPFGNGIAGFDSTGSDIRNIMVTDWGGNPI